MLVVGSDVSTTLGVVASLLSVGSTVPFDASSLLVVASDVSSLLGGVSTTGGDAGFASSAYNEGDGETMLGNGCVVSDAEDSASDTATTGETSEDFDSTSVLFCVSSLATGALSTRGVSSSETSVFGASDAASVLCDACDVSLLFIDVFLCYFQTTVISIVPVVVILNPVLNAISYILLRYPIESIVAGKVMVPILGVVCVSASSNSITPLPTGVFTTMACKTPGPIFTSVVVAVAMLV